MGLSAVELFCGAGGLSRGLRDAGISVVAAYDHLPIAVQTYNMNLPSVARVADLSRPSNVLPEIMTLKPDMICGGPPCQDFSSAGKREEAANAELTVTFAMIIAAAKPEWFLMENVIEALTSEAYNVAREILLKAGYGISESKINCAYYGVPQERRRLFVVGRLGERADFLVNAIEQAKSKKPLPVRSLFSDQSRSFLRERSLRQRIFLDENLKQLYRADDQHLGSAEMLYMRRQFDSPRYVPLDKPIPTITGSSYAGTGALSRREALDAGPPTSVAYPTLRQYGEMQGFPSNWRWPKNIDECSKMIGNSVPAATAAIIGGIILARQQGRTTLMFDQAEFLDWLRQGGRSATRARNIKSSLWRARRILEGRTFHNVEEEIAVLESMAEFKEVRSLNAQSDMRSALRCHAEFLDARQERKRPKRRDRRPMVDPVSEADTRKFDFDGLDSMPMTPFLHDEDAPSNVRDEK